LFTALPFIAPQDEVLVGLPDTIWFPTAGFAFLPMTVSFLFFPVAQPELFDAVITDDTGSVEKSGETAGAGSRWIWAHQMAGRELATLHRLWCGGNAAIKYSVLLVNA